MAVRIRLKRFGSKNSVYWRVVVSDARMPRDGRFIEEVGFYDPRANPARIELDGERIRYWIAKGARPSETVGHLIKKKGVAQADGASSVKN